MQTVAGQSEGSREILWEEEDENGGSGFSGTHNSAENTAWLETAAGSKVDSENPADVEPEPEAVEDTAEDVKKEEPVLEEAVEEPPAYEINQSRVAKLGQALRDAGARLFFHVEDDVRESEEHEPPAAEQESSPAPPEILEEKNEEKPVATAAIEEEEQQETFTEVKSEEEPEEEIAHEEPAVPEKPDEAEKEIGVNSFEDSFELFLSGDLDNCSAMNLSEDALIHGNLDEARELLHFTPTDNTEGIRRRRLLVAYYMATDRPGAALDIIKELRNDEVEDDDKQKLLKMKAQCQKLTNDLEGSYQTCLRIKEMFPSEENEAKAKRSYERYLNSQCDDALVLEKMTSLHGE